METPMCVSIPRLRLIDWLKILFYCLFAETISYYVLYDISAWRPFYGTKANSIAPDETPQYAASHLGLFCLPRESSSKNGT